MRELLTLEVVVLGCTLGFDTGDVLAETGNVGAAVPVLSSLAEGSETTAETLVVVEDSVPEPVSTTSEAPEAVSEGGGFAAPVTALPLADAPDAALLDDAAFVDVGVDFDVVGSVLRDEVVVAEWELDFGVVCEEV